MTFIYIYDSLMMHSVQGIYTTKRDGGIVYTYELTWYETEQGANWDAKVWRDGLAVGTPGGTLLDRNVLEYGELAIGMVEASIEQRVGLD
jgi:hypothetical protein